MAEFHRSPTILKWSALVLETGAAILLGAYLLGAFEYPERVELSESIARGEQVPTSDPMAMELIDHFSQSPPPPDSKLVRPEPTWERPRGDGVYLITASGERTLVCDISDLRSWSGSESPVYGWLTLVLVVGGIVCTALLLRVESRDAA